jgi:hypothetical protein
LRKAKTVRFRDAVVYALHSGGHKIENFFEIQLKPKTNPHAQIK